MCATENIRKIASPIYLSKFMPSLCQIFRSDLPDNFDPHLFGLQCKLFIDNQRTEYLRGLGFDAKIYEYVSSDVSLENRLILATNFV